MLGNAGLRPAARYGGVRFVSLTIRDISGNFIFGAMYFPVIPYLQPTPRVLCFDKKIRFLPGFWIFPDFLSNCGGV